MNTLIVFSHLRWNFVFQRPQHLLTHLSKRYSIIFIEEPLYTEGDPFVHFSIVRPSITVLVPHTNEKNHGFNDAQIKAIEPLLIPWLKKHSDYGIWFYTPQALRFLDHFHPKLVIFDVMDELSSFFGAPPELKHREADLLALADVVITGGPSLHRAKSQVRDDAILLPSAVDVDHYSPKRALSFETPSAQLSIPHPRLGFFGVIDERLNIDLIAALADADPKWNIIMVGPTVKIDPSTLPQRPNIHWLGQQPYEALPGLVQSWDVCLLPFALNDSTKFISPTKTLEYLAAEKPVVSTSVPDVVELYGEFIEVADTPLEFIAAVQKALHEGKLDQLKRVQKARTVVAESSWSKAAKVVYDAIKDALRQKRVKIT